MELKDIETKLIDLALSSQITGDELIYLLKATRKYNKYQTKVASNTETSFPPYLDRPKQKSI